MREATADFLAEAGKRYGGCRCDLITADFGTTAGVLALWSGYGTKDFGETTFDSGLALVRVEGGGERADGTTEPLSFTLPWFDAGTGRQFVADAFASRTGGPVRVMRAWLKDDGTLVADPNLYRWGGRISRCTVVEGARSDASGPPVTVRVQAEEYQDRRDRSTWGRITHARQLDRDPTDLGLEYQATISQRSLEWGSRYANREKED